MPKISSRGSAPHPAGATPQTPKVGGRTGAPPQGGWVVGRGVLDRVVGLRRSGGWVGGRTPPPWTGWSDAGRGWSDAGCETVKIFFARCAREVKFSFWLLRFLEKRFHNPIQPFASIGLWLRIRPYN